MSNQGHDRAFRQRQKLDVALRRWISPRLRVVLKHLVFLRGHSTQVPNRSLSVPKRKLWMSKLPFLMGQ